MTLQVQELIDKIQQEGIDQAKARAADIEEAAKKKAEEMVAHARQEAAAILDRATRERDRFDKAARLGLRQAARDTILGVRQELNQMLKRIISAKVQESLGVEVLAAMLTQIAKVEKGDWVVRLSEADHKKIQQGAMAKLKEQLTQKIIFQSRDDLRAGLTVSFDAGKTFFDFSDANLAEYIGSLASQELAKILDESVNA